MLCSMGDVIVEIIPTMVSPVMPDRNSISNSLTDVIDKFCELRRQYNLQHGIKKRGHINLTGGEPFCRADIRDIIGYIHKRCDELTYGVLSNGSFIDDELMKLLKQTDVSFVQLSIDGDRKTHDFLLPLIIFAAQKLGFL